MTAKQIQENYREIKDTLPKEVCLIAVSKTKPIEAIQALYEVGVRDFGENKVGEMCEKYEALPKDIRWHMIGHLQSNKVKYMNEFVHLIHGVHKLKLLKEINKRAEQAGRIQKVLLQVKIAEEDSKFGMSLAQAKSILKKETLESLPHISVQGLMGMATHTDDMQQVREEFKLLYQLYKDLKEDYPDLNILSMGMSGDYNIAIEEGSTMVRIGSSIFGTRK